jgi:hypothetical protein
MSEEEKLSSYLSKSKLIPNSNYEKKIRIAILGGFTLNGLEETMRVKCDEKKIKDVISAKHLTNLPDIYNEYQAVYSYINENFINMGSKIGDDFEDNDIITTFGELLRVNKYINDP